MFMVSFYLEIMGIISCSPPALTEKQNTCSQRVRSIHRNSQLFPTEITNVSLLSTLKEKACFQINSHFCQAFL